MFRNILKAVVGDPHEREVKRYRETVKEINTFEPEMKALTNEQLRAKTDEFRKRLSEGEELDDLMFEAFAVVREAAVRAIGLRHFDEQLIGGMVLHQGKIAEMKTGEGKTLVPPPPLHLISPTATALHRPTPNPYRT